MRINRSQSGCSRSGALTVELLVAGVLLSTVLSMIVPMLAQISRINEEITDRELALRTVRNIVTEVRESEQTAQFLPTEVSERLEQAELTINTDWDQTLEAERVTVSLIWINRSGEPTDPTALSFWRLAKEDQR